MSSSDKRLVEALRLARKTAADVALMAAPEHREEAYRLVAVTAARIRRMVSDAETRHRMATQRKRGKDYRP